MDPNPLQKIEKTKVIRVDQFENHKVVKFGMIGETTGLGPCFGVIIYDPQSKQAIVGHFVDPRATVFNDFNTMLADAKKLFKDINQVMVYVGGGAPEPDDAPDFKHDKEKRTFVQDKLNENGFKNLKINYQNSMDSTIMRIDTRTGLVNYKTISHWEDED